MFKIVLEVNLSHETRRLLMALKDDLVAAGAKLTVAVDNLAARLAANTFVGTVADSDVQAAIDNENAQAARVDALSPTPPATA